MHLGMWPTIFAIPEGLFWLNSILDFLRGHPILCAILTAGIVYLFFTPGRNWPIYCFQKKVWSDLEWFCNHRIPQPVGQDAFDVCCNDELRAAGGWPSKGYDFVLIDDSEEIDKGGKKVLYVEVKSWSKWLFATTRAAAEAVALLDEARTQRNTDGKIVEKVPAIIIYKSFRVRFWIKKTWTYPWNLPDGIETSRQKDLRGVLTRILSWYTPTPPNGRAS